MSRSLADAHAHSVTSPKIVDRSPLSVSRRTLNTLLESAVLDPHTQATHRLGSGRRMTRRAAAASSSKDSDTGEHKQCLSESPVFAEHGPTRAPSRRAAAAAAKKLAATSSTGSAGTTRRNSRPAEEITADDENAEQLGQVLKGVRCIFLDRDIAEMSPSRHMKLLQGTPTVTARTLKTVLLRQSQKPESDSRESLLIQYVKALHGSSPAAASNGKATAEASFTAGKAGKRSALTQDTPVKVLAKKAKSRATVTTTGALPLRPGQVLELDRHSFQVGSVAANGAMATLFFGNCLAGKHAGMSQPRQPSHLVQSLCLLTDGSKSSQARR